jgi:HK97 family phage major capsid protein
MPYEFSEAALRGKSAKDLYVIREEKRAELKNQFEKSAVEVDGKTEYALKGAALDEVRVRNEELNLISSVYEEKSEIERIAASVSAGSKGHQVYGNNTPVPTVGAKDADKPSVKNLGEAFIESKAGIEKGFEKEIPDFNFKTLMATSAGWEPENVRSGLFAYSAQRIPNLLDVLPSQQINQPQFVFMRETTFTNNAAEVAEAGTYGEAALVATEVSSPARKIGVWLPVTDEQLADVSGAQSYIQDRLTLMLRQRLETQIISGDGTAPNISGLLDISGTQTQAKGADPVPDAIYRSMTKVRVTGRANPNVVLMHPNDWQDVRLLRTADGIYIWGSPSEPGQARIWGLPVYESTAVTENTGIVMDTSHFLLFYRAGISFKVTDSHASDFISGKQAIRAEFRVGLADIRAAALCTTTGI